MSKAPPAAGRVEGDAVVVAEPAQAARLHAKGAVGDLGTDGRLRLRLVEAAWLASEGRLQVESRGRVLAAVDLLALGASERAEVEFLAYADLRSRGLPVRRWHGGWAVWPRGTAAGSPEAPEFAVEVRAEDHVATYADIAAWANREPRTVLALVDEDGTATFYRAEPETPAGTCPLAEAAPVAGTVLADRVVVVGAAATRLHGREHVGEPTAAGLFLSFTEAEALRRRGVLDVPATLAAKASAVQPHFLRSVPVYEALRSAGVVAKSGFRFGTHLRGYRGDPDTSHAEWLVQCVLPAETVQWAELSRAVRLAHGVRKRFLVAVVGEGGTVGFVRVSWFKP